MISLNSDCTGCGACKFACPKDAIEINYSRGNFLEPVVDLDLCVDCGFCEKVCPNNITTNNKNIKSVFAGVNNDVEALKKSTSGGAFYSIAESVLSMGGVVYGCAYTEHLRAKHVRVDNIENLVRLQGSKYVQSEIGNTYLDVKKDLESKRIVLFSGTPCQIAGLYGFLDGDYDDLITIDIICHGVSSQLFFDKYIKWYEKKHNIVVNNYDFRSKENKGWSLSGIVIGDKKGKEIKRKIYYFSEFYYFYFLKGTIYRSSCYTCKYTNTHRLGDITLGDCWGIESLNTNLSIKNGCSLIILNSDKGINLLKKTDIELIEIPFEKVISYNRQLVEPSIKPQNRKSIIDRFSDLDGKDIDRAFKKEEKKSIMIGRIKYLFPSSARKLLSRIRNK